MPDATPTDEYLIYRQVLDQLVNASDAEWSSAVARTTLAIDNGMYSSELALCQGLPPEFDEACEELVARIDLAIDLTELLGGDYELVDASTDALQPDTMHSAVHFVTAIGFDEARTTAMLASGTIGPKPCKLCGKLRVMTFRKTVEGWEGGGVGKLNFHWSGP